MSVDILDKISLPRLLIEMPDASTPPAKRQQRSPPVAARGPGDDGTRLPPISQVARAAQPNIQTQSPTTPTTPSQSRKRRLSQSPKLDTLPPGANLPATSEATNSVSISSLLSEDVGKKRSRTNTPWTAAEEQRLKQMRDVGHSWSDIAKAFPNRTEGSVKKHWYKDMHYAEFAEDESAALREAIKEYEANKWKIIGQKLGKPAKACEQYAREHFKNL